MTIRVVVADDQGIVRSGLRSLLSDEPDIDVVGEASDGHLAVAAVRLHHPDVALIDIRMPNLDGLSALRQIVASGSSTRVLILTTYGLDEYVFEALRAGAGGFLLKNAPVEQLAAAIRELAAGDALLSPSVTRRVIEAFATIRSPDPVLTATLDDLTERETVVLRLLAAGCSNAEIADELIVSIATVKTHVSNVLSKLGARDRVGAVIFAYESGLVTPRESGDSTAPA